MAARVPDPKVGDKFGYYTVTSDPFYVGSRKLYNVVCACGQERQVRKDGLTSGHSNSCGCLNRENVSKAAKTHGKSSSDIYWVWNMMKQRCHNPKCAHYEKYGGRGIAVCEEWRVFENFYLDMGDPPFPGATLERIDTNGGYNPNNVVWASVKTQNNNKRTSVRFNYKGRDYSLKELAQLSGMKESTLRVRLHRGATSVEEAVDTPVGDAKSAYRYGGPGRQVGHKLYE